MSDSADIYVLDTNGIIDLKRLLSSETRSARKVVANELLELVAAGRACFPIQVLGELERHHEEIADDLPWEVACACKSRAVILDDPDLWPHVRTVLSKCSAVLDTEKTSGADEADPYVVAMAIALADAGRQPIVVTRDNRDKPTKMSLVSACGVFRIPTMSMQALLHFEGLWETKGWRRA